MGWEMSLERIAALLAKAERTDNAAEAEAYLMKAQALATAASVDLALARARTARVEARQQPEMRTVTIGEKGKRANQHLISLFVAVAHANDSNVDVASNSTFVIVFGMPSDLEVIDALYASLAVQMTTSAQHWLNAGLWRTETYVAIARVDGRRRRQTKPHTAQTARVAFYRAFVERIRERLDEAKAQARAEALRPRASDAGLDRALVLKGKDAEIRDFHRANSQARGTWGGYSGAVRGDGGSSGRAGRRAAELARVSAQRALPGKPAVEG